MEKLASSYIESILLILIIEGLVQDCSNSSAEAVELLQFCTKPSIWQMEFGFYPLAS